MKKIKCNFSLISQVVALLLWVISIGCLALPAHASCIYENFQGWQDCFIKDKLSTHINSVDIEVFRRAQFVPRVIELDRKQPEKQLTFDEYLERIDLDKKILKGKAFYRENYALLEQVGKEYNVEPAVIVALIGLESHYGAIMGKFNVIDALATLSYEGRRKTFFEKELIRLLQIARNEGLPYEDFRGSWAGAMGQVQFMPSSYVEYAVDYDQDGKADIWYSVADASASAANYLKHHGWVHGNITIQYHAEVKNISAKCENIHQICHLNDDMRLIFLKDGVTLGAFEVSKNFEVLMKWNRSLYFGLAVFKIAQEIARSA